MNIRKNIDYNEMYETLDKLSIPREIAHLYRLN